MQKIRLLSLSPKTGHNIHVRKNGFTLIELVIVIVILGLLAATATIRFFDMQADARTRVIQQIEASMRTSQNLIHTKSLLAGNQDQAASTVTVNGATIVNTLYGYSQGSDLVDKLLILDPLSDFIIFKNATVALIGHSGASNWFTCFTASVTPNLVDSEPVYVTNVTNCN